MLDLIREISQTIRCNRLRTFLTGISVAWGVFMLILLLGAARGTVNSFEADSGSMASNKMQIWGEYTTMPYNGYKQGRSIELRWDDMNPLVHDNSSVSAAMAYTRVDTAKIFGPSDYTDGGYMAVYPEAMASERVTMSAGRFINARDIDEHRRMIVLPSRSASILFGSDSAAVGQTVRCLDLGWRVVGVYSHQWRSTSYVPYTTHKALTGNDNNVDRLEVRLDGIDTESAALQAEDDVRATLARRHGFHPDDRGALWVWNSLKQNIAAASVGKIMVLAVWIIGLLTLLTGIVGVSNIMFVSVRERTHEIGIRRAIGARPRSILLQVLAESVAITALFGYIGVFFGMLILQIVDETGVVADYGFLNATVDISIAVEVTVALVLSGALAGLFPALKAIKVKPVEALRDE